MSLGDPLPVWDQGYFESLLSTNANAAFEYASAYQRGTSMDRAFNKMTGFTNTTFVQMYGADS